MRLYPEPICINIMKSQGFIKIAGRRISFNHLEISLGCPLLFALLQKCSTDLAGISLVAKIFTDMNGIKPNIITIQDSKPRGNNFSIIPDRSTYRIFHNGVIHGRNYRTVNGINGSLQIKETSGMSSVSVTRSHGAERSVPSKEAAITLVVCWIS